MTPDQTSAWETNQLRLIQELHHDKRANLFSVAQYEVRIVLNADQDIVVFPATLPDRDVTSENDLPVGMVIETFEGGRKAGDPETTKLMGLYCDWQACLYHILGVVTVGEVVL